MDLATVDLRWLTALCKIATGIIGASYALHVWWCPPKQRGPLLGVYYTEKGLRRLLHYLPLMFLFSVWLIVTGVGRWAYYERWQGVLKDQTAAAIGIFEALLGLIVVALIVRHHLRVRWRDGAE